MFFQERLKTLFKMPQVDKELLNQTGEFRKVAHSLSFRHSEIEMELVRMSSFVRKSNLDREIKDNLISRELKLQKTTIQNKLANKTPATENAFSVNEAQKPCRQPKPKFE